jgi:hypothetical protein
LQRAQPGLCASNLRVGVRMLVLACEARSASLSGSSSRSLAEALVAARDVSPAGGKGRHMNWACPPVLTGAATTRWVTSLAMVGAHQMAATDRCRLTARPRSVRCRPPRTAHPAADRPSESCCGTLRSWPSRSWPCDPGAARRRRERTPRTDGGDALTSPRRAAKAAQHLPAEVLPGRAAGEDDGVRVVDDVEPVNDRHSQAAVGGHRPGTAVQTRTWYPGRLDRTPCPLPPS